MSVYVWTCLYSNHKEYKGCSYMSVYAWTCLYTVITTKFTCKSSVFLYVSLCMDMHVCTVITRNTRCSCMSVYVWTCLYSNHKEYKVFLYVSLCMDMSVQYNHNEVYM